jgi:hypothetical protein
VGPTAQPQPTGRVSSWMDMDGAKPRWSIGVYDLLGLDRSIEGVWTGAEVAKTVAVLFKRKAESVSGPRGAGGASLVVVVTVRHGGLRWAC